MDTNELSGIQLGSSPQDVEAAGSQKDSTQFSTTNPTSAFGCAVVTGSARGIGRAVCEALAAAGFDVVVNHSHASSSEAAEATAAHLRATFGVRALAIQADVSVFDEAHALIAQATEQLGPVTVLVNNAGITRDGLLVRMKEADFDRVIEVNLKGVFNCCRAVTPSMVKARCGRIISLSSVSGVHGNAGQVNYAASKAGIVGLTKSLAREVASRGVTVNAVAPGFIQTSMTDAMPEKAREAVLAGIPMKRMGQPQDVAAVVAFLASEAASYVTGQVIEVNGGLAL